MRSLLITFLVLSVPVSIAFFVEGLSVKEWAICVAYCALLPAMSIGLARLHRHLLFAHIATAIVLTIGAGLWLLSRLDALTAFEWLGIYLRISLYAIYGLVAVGVCLAARGWWLYWLDSSHSTPT